MAETVVTVLEAILMALGAFVVCLWTVVAVWLGAAAVVQRHRNNRSLKSPAARLARMRERSGSNRWN